MIVRSQGGTSLIIIGVGCELEAYDGDIYCELAGRSRAFKLGSYVSQEEAVQVVDKIYQNYGKIGRYDMPDSGWSEEEITITIGDDAKNVKDVSLESLDFSVRTYNCLKRHNLHTLADLLKISEQELLNVRNLGTKSAEEVINKLAILGFSLEQE